MASLTQADVLTLSSRAFHNSSLGEFAEYVCKYFGYEKVLPMNTGAEAWETGVKLARRWAYDVKKVPKDQAIVVRLYYAHVRLLLRKTIFMDAP